jgi:hypothetical protein
MNYYMVEELNKKQDHYHQDLNLLHVLEIMVDYYLKIKSLIKEEITFLLLTNLKFDFLNNQFLYYK